MEVLFLEKNYKCVLSSYALLYRIVHFDLTTRVVHAYEMENFNQGFVS
jgi:hypothetical protein